MFVKTASTRVDAACIVVQQHSYIIAISYRKEKDPSTCSKPTGPFQHSQAPAMEAETGSRG